MAYMDADAPSVEPDSKTKDKQPNARLRKYWREIEAYNKAAEDWHKQSDTIVKMYLDQHRNATPGQSLQRRFALLWSNIETLKPAVYAKTPTILCSRRHKDPDPIGRVAAEILERATNATFDLYKADERFRMVRDDRLLVSRGTAWVRYEADTTGDKINYEKACIDYVHWKDFGHNVAGTWADVWLVWRKVYKTRQEVRDRFDKNGKKVSDKLSYSAKTAADDDKEMGEHKACLFELWDKTKNKTCFISKDCPDILEDGAPPINFRDFFPCPEPCYGSRTSKSLFPTPDYRYYQDQAQEIDDLTQQIASITDLLSPKGFVPAGPSGDGADAVKTLIQSLQSQITQNKTIFIPVEAWAAFSEKGGAKGLVEWMPVGEFVKTLQGAIDARNQLVQDVYQITGIADILRGQTDPDETLGAQQLKAQTGARRVKNAKDEIARFCKDIGQLVAEVIAEQFQPETLAAMSGFAYVPVAPAAPPLQPGLPQDRTPLAQPQSPSGKTFDDNVLNLLRDDRMRGFLIDIETDSTIQPDEDAEKQRRIEFITATGGFLKEAAELMAGAPSLSPMISEMLLFGVRGFRVGRQMEDVIETTLNRVAQELQQKQQQPTPEQQQAQAEMQAKQAELQMKQQEMEMKLQLEREKLALEREKAQIDLQVQERELQIKIAEAEANMALKQQEMQAKMQLEAQSAALDAQIKEKQAAIDAKIAQDKAVQDASIKQQEAEQGAQIKRAEHGQRIQIEGLKADDDRQIKLAAAQREARAHENDEVRKDETAKAQIDSIKQRAAHAMKPKKVAVNNRAGDGKVSEYEVH